MQFEKSQSEFVDSIATHFAASIAFDGSLSVSNLAPTAAMGMKLPLSCIQKTTTTIV
jgi:hypothetical protein